MRCGNREMKHRSCKNDRCRVQVCSKAVDRLHAENFIADSTDDFPAANTCSEAHGKSAGNFYFPRNFKRSDIAARKKCQRDNTHGFLSIIGTMGKCHKCGRKDLNMGGDIVDSGLAYVAENKV